MNMESTTNKDVRSNNRKRLINLLFRQGQMTKQELAVKLNISLPTVTTILKELAEKGLVTTGQAMDSTGGRKALCYMPVVDAKYSLGVEASEEGLRVAALNLGGHIMAKEYFPLKRENTENYWKTVNRILGEFGKRYVEQQEKLLDIGITLEVSMQDGKIIPEKGQKAQDILDLDLAESCFPMHVKFRNSTKMAALAQVWVLENRSSFVFVKLGKHVRGALVHHGLVVEFANINGEFGNILVNSGSKSGGMRLRECLSAENLCRRAGTADMEGFFRKIEEGDHEVNSLWENYLDELAVFFYNLYCIFGWGIVVGGLMSPYIEQYKREVEERIRAKGCLAREEKISLTISELGENGAVVGAALLPIDEFLEVGYDEI